MEGEGEEEGDQKDTFRPVQDTFKKYLDTFKKISEKNSRYRYYQKKYLDTFEILYKQISK